MVQIQRRKHVLDHAGYTTYTRQNELDQTDHLSALKDLDHEL